MEGFNNGGQIPAHGNELKDIDIVIRTIGLLNSMVDSKEAHSKESIKQVDKGIKAVIRLDGQLKKQRP